MCVIKKVVEEIIKDILTSIYQPFGVALVVAFLGMYLYMFLQKHSLKEAIKVWKENFKLVKDFRRTFFLVVYTAIAAYNTLVNKSMWVNTVNDVLGGWTCYNSKGELSVECFRNLLLLMPLIFLLFWAKKDRLLSKVSFGATCTKAFKISLEIALFIQCFRLFFRIGAVRIADFVYQIIGGVIGGIIYYLMYRCKHRGD